MNSSRRSGAHESSHRLNRPSRPASGDCRGFIESLEPRRLLSAAGSVAELATATQSAIVQAQTPSVVLGSVSGLVTDVHGKPIADAFVYATSTTSAAILTTIVKTNSTGHYTIPADATGTYPQVEAGKYQVHASASGYETAASAAFTVGAGANTAPTIKLTAIVYGSVTGLVTTTAGKPIDGAFVTISTSPSKSGGTVISVSANSSGRYTFAKVPVGDYQIRASKSGYNENRFYDTVKAGDNEEPALALNDWAVIAGAVTDTKDVALPGATVTISSSTSTAVLASTTTDDAGNYYFRTLPPGTYIVHATHTGYTAESSGRFTTYFGSVNTELPLKLAPNAFSTVSGVVTDSKGHPIANASIVLGVPPATTTTLTAKTNASGHYSISHVPLRAYTVQAAALGYNSATSASFSVASSSTTAPTLVLTQAVLINGTVTDAAGTPVAGASVALMPAGSASEAGSATTNSSGHYTIQVKDAGSYVVQGSKTGYMSATSASFKVAIGSNTAPTLKLTQIIYGSVTGVVTDSKGKAIANALILVSPSPETSTSIGRIAQTNASGQYTISNVPVGMYTAEANVTGYDTAVSAPFKVVKGNNTAPTLVLTHAVVITGKVTNAGGTGLAGVSVAIMAAGGTTVAATATTDSSGQYTVQGLPAGSYVVSGTKTGYTGAPSASFKVAAGNNTAPTLVLSQPVNLSGKVTDAVGKPLANVTVSIFTSAVSDKATPVATFTTSFAGLYVTDRVSPGSYFVTASLAGYVTAKSTIFTIVAGENVAPTLALTIAINSTGI